MEANGQATYTDRFTTDELHLPALWTGVLANLRAGLGTLGDSRNTMPLLFSL